MTKSQEQGAWLRSAEGEVYPLRGSCSFGRGLRNSVVLRSSKISRRHALIHVQNIGEFWLIDFGSSNGTFLNKRRILQPVRLGHGDQIVVGDRHFEFHQPEELSAEFRTMVTQRTLHETKMTSCWLLVADIHNFTPMSRNLKTEDLEALLGAWLSECKDVIENHHGLINKYLGDGFLAYWREEETSREEIASVLSSLREVQSKNAPEFRVVLHFGPVAIGGVASMGEESLLGKEVNLVFRLENLGRKLGEACGLSDKAHEKLGELVPVRCLGEHQLKGFKVPRTFFGVL